MNKKPRIAIPLGDPAGVGPEIVVKSIASQEVFDAAECVVIGDKKIIDKAIEITGADITVHVITEPEDGDFRPSVLNLIDLDNVDMTKFEYGKVNGMCGQAAFAYIEKSIALANAGRVDAVATTPINKESLRAGNINFIGHTEIFGALTNTEDPLTMFETNGMRVFFLTRHVSLRDMLDMIKKDRIKTTVVSMTELGLVQITRKKIRPSLQQMMTTKCRCCEGTGKMPSLDWTVTQMRREVTTIFENTIYQQVTITADKRLLLAFCGEKNVFQKELENTFSKKIVCIPKQDMDFGTFVIEKEKNIKNNII